jgi:hypothetical protein
MLTRFGNPCDVACGGSGITPISHHKNEETKKGKNMSAIGTNSSVTISICKRGCNDNIPVRTIVLAGRPKRFLDLV